jgi:hypothetical protein
MPQRPPVTQEDEALEDVALPPFTLAAIVDTFFRTSPLPQAGQTISAAGVVLRTSFSKELPQVGQTYS